MKNSIKLLGITAITAVMLFAMTALSLTGCDSGGGGGGTKPNTTPTKPALTDVFDFTQPSAGAVESKISAAFDAIWASGSDGQQLLLDLAAKTGKIQVQYTDSGDGLLYANGGGLLIRGSTADEANFTDLLKAKLKEAKNDATFK